MSAQRRWGPTGCVTGPPPPPRPTWFQNEVLGFRSPCLGPGWQLVSRSGAQFHPRPSSAVRTAFTLPRPSVSLLIRKLPLELKYVSQMNLLHSSPRCDSLVLVVRQSHPEVAYGDTNISAVITSSALSHVPVPGCLLTAGLAAGGVGGLDSPTGLGGSSGSHSSVWCPLLGPCSGPGSERGLLEVKRAQAYSGS